MAPWAFSGSCLVWNWSVASGGLPHLDWERPQDRCWGYSILVSWKIYSAELNQRKQTVRHYALWCSDHVSLSALLPWSFLHFGVIFSNIQM